MPGMINTIDRAFNRLLTSQNRVLRAGDRLFARAFGQVRSTRPATAQGPAMNNMFMVSHDQGLGSNSALTGLSVVIKVGGTITAKKDTYRIISEFAKGGMSQLFLVKDSQGRECLLKQLVTPAEFPLNKRQEMRIRFGNETNIMENIDSKHVVGLVDCDPQPYPTYYIMEKISGTDIDKLVRTGKSISPKVAISMIIQVLRGLSAFERAVVCKGLDMPIAHRDIKPENIFLEMVEGKRIKRVVLGDFGIAKLPGSELTQEAQIYGTYGYMPPESFTGSKDADQRSDIFSLGAVLYFLFTGEEPFTFSNDPSQILAFLAKPGEHIATLYLKRPPEIAPDMWDAVFNALHPEPAKRYQTYSAFMTVMQDLYRRY